MKKIGTRQCQAELAAALQSAQDGPVLIVRHMRPVAVLIGIEGEALDDVEAAEHAKRLTQLLAAHC